MIPFDEEEERRYQRGPGPPDPNEWIPDGYIPEPKRRLPDDGETE